MTSAQQRQLKSVFADKRVFVTGHLGFKGRALCAALQKLDARVTGFDIRESRDAWDDVRHLRRLAAAIRAAQPDFVFHLAAQAFVPVGYEEPLRTFETNALGTVNLLEVLRDMKKPCAVVVVTTDKVYGSDDAVAHVEEDPLKSFCPYSASKVAAEAAVEAYRRGFFAPAHDIAVATARAGNVIGTGDQGEGRLLPNAIRALRENRAVEVYNPGAVRPWQYIDDVVDGYLLLAAALARAEGSDRARLATAWNFGPAASHTTLEVVEALISAWGSGIWVHKPTQLREANVLRIDSTKARLMLGWKPCWPLDIAIREIVRQERSA